MPLSPVQPLPSVRVARATSPRTPTLRLPVISWNVFLGALLVVSFLIPARRYTLSSNLPFQLEPYRVAAGAVFLCWISSALVDPRVRLRHTPFDRPFCAVLLVSMISLAVNVGHATSVAPFVLKQLMFFASLCLLVYFITSVLAGRPDMVLTIAKLLVCLGVFLSISAIVEARTGENIFLHIDRVVPVLQQGKIYKEGISTDARGAAHRAFGAAQHPIEFGAIIVMLMPLALALGGATGQRRWWLASALMAPAMVGALSRTVVPMIVVAIIFGIWTRREIVRLWPALIPLIVAIHFAVPGALGTLTKAFFPEQGLIADQQAGYVGGSRFGTFGPVFYGEFVPHPVFGVGFSTRVTTSDDPTVEMNAPNVDDQWLSILLETGVVGFTAMLWLLFRIIKRCGQSARIDYTARGWILAGITSAIGAYAVGMLTFNSFAFVQVTLLFATLVGMASALVIDRRATNDLRGVT